MAVNTDIKTPLTLIPNQELSIADGKSSIVCFNDSKLSQGHYRTIPKDQSNEGRIRWANKPSVLIPLDNDYAIAVSMFEYHPDYREVTNLIARGQQTGELIEVPERGFMVIAKDPFVYDSDRRMLFRKIVWVKATDLVLGSAAQQQAKKDKDDADEAQILANALKNPKPPETGNKDKNGNSIWITLAIILVLLGGSIWALIAWLKRRKKENEMEAGVKPNPNIQIIKIPKST